MCDSHTHGPNAVATAPQHISAQNYLSPVSKRIGTAPQTLLQNLLSVHPFNDAQRSMYNSFHSTQEKMIFLADHMTKYYTDLASISYANGNITQGDALMEEMKKCIAQIHNGVL